MLVFLLILIIIASCLLVVIILAQNPKGGGLSNIGAGASQFLGARQTADFLEKSTWYFGIGILVVVMFTYFLTSSPADNTKTVTNKTDNVEYNMPVGGGMTKKPEGPKKENAPGIKVETKGGNQPAPEPKK